MNDFRSIRNLEAERGVLGAMILDNDRISEVAAVLKADDFHLDAHQALYAAILDLWGTGRPVDGIGLADSLGARYGALGGDSLLASVATVPHARNAAYHAGVVREKSLVRGLLDIAREIETKSAAMEEHAGDLIGHAQGRMMDLLKSGLRSKAKGPSALADEMRGRLLARQSGQPIGLKTGITDLDAAMGPMEPGMLIIVGARPSNGKTAMILNVCEYLSVRCQVPTLFLSLEMLTGELMDRMTASVANVHLEAIRTGRLSPGEYDACAIATDAIEASQLHIDDGRGMTLTQVCATARMYRQQHGIQLLALDYIAKVQETQARNENRWEVVKRVSNRLKDLAGELGIPVVVAAQINRQAGSDRPTMSQLRESGDIEADADVIALLHRPEKYDPNDRPGQIEVIVDKARNSATGMTALQFDGPHQRISNLTYPRLQEAAF